MTMRMISCNSYCLYKSLKMVNVIVNIIGMMIIIYSLWLLKMWIHGVAELPSPSALPTPWFIQVCLGVGIVVCLSTLWGHMVTNCITNSLLAVYIVSMLALLLIQAGVTIVILFRTDRDTQIIRYIDEQNKEFKAFLLFHIVICRSISILVLVAQINVVVLAATLWAVGGEPTIHSHISGTFDVRQSFLADFNSPAMAMAMDDRGSLEKILKSYMQGIFRNST